MPDHSCANWYPIHTKIKPRRHQVIEEFSVVCQKKCETVKDNKVEITLLRHNNKQWRNTGGGKRNAAESFISQTKCPLQMQEL
jgi:hypothetical protein